MNQQCPKCHNVVVGQFKASTSRNILTTIAKKGGTKAILGGVGGPMGFALGVAVDLVAKDHINKLVDNVADEFDGNKVYVFECPNCGHTWTRTSKPEIKSYSTLPTGLIYDKVESILIEKLDVDADEIYLEAQLISDLGADSLDAVEIIMEVEKEFNIDIPDSEAENVRTVGDIIHYLQDRLGIDDEEDYEEEDDDDDENPIGLHCDGFIAEQEGDLQKALDYYIKAGEWGTDDVIRVRKMIADNPKTSKSTSPEPLTNNVASDLELEYVDELKACIEDGGEISKGERRLLEKLRIKLNITEERAAELEQSLSTPQLSEVEQEYLAEYRECLAEGGEISSGERRLLNRLRDKLGISEQRASELEQIG